MTTQSAAPDREVAPGPVRRKPLRSRRLMVGGGVLAIAVVTAVVITNPFGDGNEAAPTSTVGTALVPVKEGALSAQVNQQGTLAYVGRADGTPQQVINRATGIYTWLPAAGTQIGCGKVVYWVSATPVLLLCGSEPAYRDLSQGDEGKDVRELNANLVRLGYAEKDDFEDDPDYFGWRTEDALEELQDDIGAEETGELELGDAVVLPGPLRIGKTTGRQGANAMPGQSVAEATSADREVTVQLEASQQTQVKINDRARITLPDNRTVQGKVTRIGTVASKEGDQGAKIPVYLTLDKPKEAGKLDQAPVQVQITTAGVKKALIVPVTALVGRDGGGFAVERADPTGTRTLVPVTLGLFDNAGGQVQVTGELKAGDNVVVPSS